MRGMMICVIMLTVTQTPYGISISLKAIIQNYFKCVLGIECRVKPLGKHANLNRNIRNEI